MTVQHAPGRDASAPPTTAPPDAPVVELQPLEWDSAFFGARMGAISHRPDAGPAGASAVARAAALTQALTSVLTEARAAAYAHVIYRAPAEDIAAIWAAERAGLRLVDVGIDSSIDLRGQVPAAPGPAGGAPGAVIRPATADDLPALQSLAAGAFTLSRFAADPYFTAEQVIAFHRQWVTNLFHGLAAALLVREVDGRLAGFVSCSLSAGEGRIPLIATDAAWRRRGVGRSLVGAALRWFVAAGTHTAHVKTQAHNYPALALYHRAGFAVSKTELTFSTTLGSTELRDNQGNPAGGDRAGCRE